MSLGGEKQAGIGACEPGADHRNFHRLNIPEFPSSRTNRICIFLNPKVYRPIPSFSDGDREMLGTAAFLPARGVCSSRTPGMPRMTGRDRRAPASPARGTHVPTVRLLQWPASTFSAVLNTIHNISFYLDMMRKIREFITFYTYGNLLELMEKAPDLYWMGPPSNNSIPASIKSIQLEGWEFSMQQPTLMQAATPDILMQFAPILIIGAIFYLLIFMPMRKEAEKGGRDDGSGTTTG